MDKITHEMRLANWRPIVEECHARPEGQSAKEWLAANGINEKQYYYWQRRLREDAYKLIKKLPAAGNNDATLTFAEIPIRACTDRDSSGFIPDAIIRTPTMTIELRNTVSDQLLTRIIGGAAYAR